MNSSRPQFRSHASDASLVFSTELFTPELDQEPTPGSLNDEFVVRQVVTRAIRSCSKKREQIAAEMSNLLGAQITKRALDSYTAESAEQNRFPAQYARAFCHVTGDWELLRCVAQRAGLHVITRAERKLLELGRQTLLRDRAAAAIERLQHELQGVTLG